MMQFRQSRDEALVLFVRYLGMPVTGENTQADDQIEKRDEKEDIVDGFEQADTLPQLDRHVQGSRRRAPADTGHASESLAGSNDALLLHIDQRGAVLRAGVAVNALFL